MGGMLCTEIPFDNVYGLNFIKGSGLFMWCWSTVWQQRPIHSTAFSEVITDRLTFKIARHMKEEWMNF